MLQRLRRWSIMAALLLLTAAMARAQNVPGGQQLTIAFDTTIAPSYLDPAEVAGLATPFVFLYALHDALFKPLPGNNMAPCLAESWTESPDGLVYEFKLRAGLKFHNGDAFTAEVSNLALSATRAPQPNCCTSASRPWRSSSRSGCALCCIPPGQIS